uniref:Uncharacterized protein n=1 Tax=Oryza sativa subsp. japonica TaxID=39947 RepID=Q9FRP1_ORYSJ|nr:hypothetical protein [Oryza sativa Japonica Group]
MVNTMPLPPAPPEILLVPIDEQDRKAGVRRKDGELHGRSDGHEGTPGGEGAWDECNPVVKGCSITKYASRSGGQCGLGGIGDQNGELNGLQ